MRKIQIDYFFKNSFFPGNRCVFNFLVGIGWNLSSQPFFENKAICGDFYKPLNARFNFYVL